MTLEELGSDRARQGRNIHSTTKSGIGRQELKPVVNAQSINAKAFIRLNLQLEEMVTSARRDADQPQSPSVTGKRGVCTSTTVPSDNSSSTAVPCAGPDPVSTRRQSPDFRRPGLVVEGVEPLWRASVSQGHRLIQSRDRGHPSTRRVRTGTTTRPVPKHHIEIILEEGKPLAKGSTLVVPG